jgi:heavy metal efflux system protein
MLLAALLTVVAVFLLLGAAINSTRHALLIFAVLPAAMTGGVIALFIRGMQLNSSAAAGFIAVLTLALLQGVVIVSSIDRLRQEGAPVRAAVFKGAMIRLRLIFLTALAASFGFVPMAMATGTGANLQRPLATVMIGGVISSALVSLFMLPTLYKWVDGSKHEGGEAGP